jgi:hypothetical protein
MNGPDGIAAIVRLALKQREPRSPGRANGDVDRMLPGTVPALASLGLPSRRPPAWPPLV